MKLPQLSLRDLFWLVAGLACGCFAFGWAAYRQSEKASEWKHRWMTLNNGRMLRIELERAKLQNDDARFRELRDMVKKSDMEEWVYPEREALKATP